MIKKTILTLCLLVSCISLNAQVEKYYWLEFPDKKGSAYSLDKPEEFLSQRSVERRKKQNLPLTESDLPVSRVYLDSLKTYGGEIVHTSRWLNAVAVKTTDSLYLQKVSALDFITNTGRLRKNKTSLKNLEETTRSVLTANEILTPGEYGKAYGQIEIHNGQILHNRGYKGEGIYVALLDAGFYRVDSLEAFAHLRNAGKLKGFQDMVRDGKDILRVHTHGLLVLSAMAAYKPGEMIGTAPEASYFLIRTEQVSGSNGEDWEYPVEEAAWVAGLEWADSAGVDVINSSLGYSTFVDPALDHKPFELTGDIFIISRAAGMAASKGMIVVNSAGNSGNDPWYYITAPADAENILAVGAISLEKKIAAFSGRGPSADGRVKPDVVGVGDDTYVVGTDNKITTVDGTSLSSPVIAGLVACLWQSVRSKTSFEVMDAVRKSADRYASPNDSFGYGIPDFVLASEILKGYSEEKAFLGEIYPNPFTETIHLSYYTPTAQEVKISLFDVMGREVFSTLHKSPGLTINKLDIHPGYLNTGMYILNVKTVEGALTAKVVRR